ncbi:hypothetical protein B1A_05683, partial [mine drainage metagenome]
MTFAPESKPATPDQAAGACAATLTPVEAMLSRPAALADDFFGDHFVSASDLLRRGWTRCMLAHFLGAPDATAPNPHCASSHPMRLYVRSRVDAAETSESFGSRLTSGARRRETSTSVAERRRVDAIAWATSIPISVPPLPLNRVLELAIAYHHEIARSRMDPLSLADAPDDDPRLAAVLAVRYMRFRMAYYDELLLDLYGRPGRREAYAVLRQRVVDAIAFAYPPLADACAQFACDFGSLCQGT